VANLIYDWPKRMVARPNEATVIERAWKQLCEHKGWIEFVGWIGEPKGGVGFASLVLCHSLRLGSS